MRTLAGLFAVIISLPLLSGCERNSRVYPTTENLLEIESERLKVFEIRNGEDGILFVIGESASRRCEVEVFGVTLGNTVAVNSIEHKDKIQAVCFWEDKTYRQLENSFTNIALRIDENITVDLQLLDRENNNYLATTLVNAPVDK
ncbi:hypothetical protein ACJJIC_14675 [Microbulbifer sp. ANSA002]|uniref:hypothetical protein n=1 Tax=unclassified Microbulbifer TaxID=2619833 RepID=UPI0040420D86